MAALHAAMRDEEASRLAASVLDGTLPDEEEAEIRLSLSSRLIGRDLLCAEENRQALRLEGISPRLRAQHLGWLTCTLANSGMLTEAEQQLGHALAAAEVAGDESARAMASIGQISCLLQRGRYVAALEAIAELDQLARRSGDHVAARMAEFMRADALTALGRVGESLRLLDDGLQRGRRERSAWLSRGWLGFAAHLRFIAGSLADAQADAEAAAAMGPPPLESHVGGASALLARFQVALHTDDRAQMRASVAVARRLHGESEVSPGVRRHAAWMLALAAMQAGDPRAAARWLVLEAPSPSLSPSPSPDFGADLPSAAAERWLAPISYSPPPDTGGVLPYAVPAVPSDPAISAHVVRIGLAAGESELARSALTRAEAVERANPGVPLLAGVAAHARGLLTRDASELARAADLLAGGGRPLPHASALEDAGRALGDVDRLASALELYNTTGATADAARVATRLRTLGVRQATVSRRPTEGWESLTESELRVVRLVGRGATNRDAAERLYLSPHTVSSHLRHAFAKLRINSRVELARLLHEHDAPAVA